jgi:hypothetical protein
LPAPAGQQRELLAQVGQVHGLGPVMDFGRGLGVARTGQMQGAASSPPS